MGCGEGLILGEGGVLWCASLLCPQPDAAARLLADPECEHIVTLTAGTFTIRHPLRERLDDALMQCPLHARLADGSSPRPRDGRFRVTGDLLRDPEWALLP